MFDPSRFALFRSRSVRIFAAGQFISIVGTWMQTVAQSWLVFRLTGSPTWLGAISLASQLPVLLLAPLGGLIADRFPRKRIVLATQTLLMLQAAILAWLTLAHLIEVWHVAFLAVTMGIVNAFDIPARQSFAAEIPSESSQVQTMVALNASIFNGARVLGPPLAGLLIAAKGEGWCFLLNAFSFFAALGGFLIVQSHAAPSRPSSDSAWHDVKEGWRYVFRTPTLRTPLVFLAILNFTGMSYIVLLPIFAKHILSGGSELFGALMGAIGAGAVSATLCLLWWHPNPVTLRKLLAGSGVVLGAALLTFSHSRWPWLSLAAMFGVGFSQVTLLVGTNTWIQTHVSNAFRGRVLSLYSMVVVGMAPLGNLTLGYLSSFINPVSTLTVWGALTITAGLVYAALFGWRKFKSSGPDPSLRTEPPFLRTR